MKHKKEFSLSVTCFLLAFLCSMIWLKQREENLAAQISPHILRFHVLANSNSAKDQELKLKVKSLILDELSQTPELAAAKTKEDFCQYIQKQKIQLEDTAEDFIESLGYSYHVDIAISETYFPTKAYGDIVLPCGNYDAVEVRLGRGKGRNWWCVLYPRLCFVDVTHAIVPDTSKFQLQSLLAADDYEAILDKRDVKLNVRFKLAELPDFITNLMSQCP